MRPWVWIALAGCTHGTTPDCAQVMCGPDLDGAVLLDGAALDAAPSDAARDGDAEDAGTDAISDAPKDTSAG